MRQHTYTYPTVMELRRVGLRIEGAAVATKTRQAAPRPAATSEAPVSSRAAALGRR
jgi:hypothetical protein